MFAENINERLEVCSTEQLQRGGLVWLAGYVGRQRLPLIGVNEHFGDGVGATKWYSISSDGNLREIRQEDFQRKGVTLLPPDKQQTFPNCGLIG